MNTTSLSKALQLVGREGLMKAASSLSEEYTFDSKDATFLSFVRANLSGASDLIKQACVDHARFWGVLPECEEAMAKIAAWKPPELTSDDYALVVDKTHRKYATHTSSSTFESAIAFHDQRYRYPLHMRKVAAARLLAKAKQHHTELPAYVQTYLHKAAGLALPTPESVTTALVQRLNNTPPKFELLSEKLASLLGHMVSRPDLRHDLDFVKQAVAALEHYDVSVGLLPKYGSDIDLPEEVLSDALTFDRIEKLAGISKLAVRLINGQVVDISRLSKDALAAVNPKLASMDIGELAEVLPTLPQADADLLIRVS